MFKAHPSMNGAILLIDYPIDTIQMLFYEFSGYFSRPHGATEARSEDPVPQLGLGPRILLKYHKHGIEVVDDPVIAEGYVIGRFHISKF
jgi:hypothetical protein